jgi:(1->4)-alpha-D-glucan 1-alpha-D-glucosylmutase
LSATPFRAAYRLQLSSSFQFADARALIPYLRDLGISHLYLSPSMQARSGSTHGYDVVDPTRISDDLGGEDEFRALATAAHDAGMGLILDLVPNHMAVDDANPFWTDPGLRERFFDIDPLTGRHRRFFDIDDLAGVRQEDPAVFDETHGLVLSLVREGVVDALRIDHPDGLADPAQYFERLRAGGVGTVWIEKILESGERLRDWPVAGTVGYDFLNEVCALFVDPGAEPTFTSLWQELSRDTRGFEEVALEAKLEQATTTFEPEIDRLSRLLGDGPSEIAGAVASMPVYRSYVDPVSGVVSDEDRRWIAAAGMAPAIGSRLLLEREAPPEFVTRFQQTTPAVVAKGVEDTAFYRYARLLALCDVGGDPGRFGLSVQSFHAANADRAERFPDSLLATSTHDTKRSADVRARIAALTWVPEDWERHVRRWLALTDTLRGEHGAPDDVERYFVFQTLVGAWPIEAERLRGYMEKALREAKRNSTWIDPDLVWEGEVMAFCGALYGDREFLSHFEPFVRRVAVLGERISLATLALKLTAPGVPEIYQGDELEFRALVDPDNRRPVDWEWRQAMLARFQGGSPPDRQTLKLWLMRRLLSVRIRRPQAFAGDYRRLAAGDDVVAFMRGDELLVAVATRPGNGSGELRDAGGRWRDVLRGGERTLGEQEPLAGLLDEHGIAVLVRY